MLEREWAPRAAAPRALGHWPLLPVPSSPAPSFPCTLPFPLSLSHTHLPLSPTPNQTKHTPNNPTQTQTNLTWLDLSFNKIFRIEGLETLTRLTDLSLYANQIGVIEGLDPLSNLQVVSLGRNNIAKLEGVMYLRRFSGLHLLNLAGNPICKDEFYRSYVLSHIKHLVYLDYRRVVAADVAAAVEQHQDAMLEILAREELAAQEDAAAAERSAHGAKMKAANLDGVETLARARCSSAAPRRAAAAPFSKLHAFCAGCFWGAQTPQTPPTSLPLSPPPSQPPSKPLKTLKTPPNPPQTLVVPSNQPNQKQNPTSRWTT